MKLFEFFLNEAKTVRDYRHDDVFKKLPYWPEKRDPKFVKSDDGFHFVFSEGHLTLTSTDNEFYSQVASSDQLDTFLSKKMTGNEMIKATKRAGVPDTWNALGGLVNLPEKLITISKEDVDGKKRQRVIYDISNLQGALRALKKYGVSSDFKIAGTAAPINGKTVAQIMDMKSPQQQVFNDRKITMYHGTSSSRAAEIEKSGLLPGKTGDVYVDLIKGYSEHNVYLATDAKTAEFYGKRQAKKDGDSTYVIFKVEVPDAARLMTDDAFVYLGKNSDTIKMSLKQNGSLAYRGRIPKKFISVVGTKKA